MQYIYLLFTQQEISNTVTDPFNKTYPENGCNVYKRADLSRNYTQLSQYHLCYCVSIIERKC